MPARHSLRSLLAAAALALAGCHDTTGLGADYDHARDRWLATRPASYEFRLTVSCFCPLPPQPVTMAVQGDARVSLVDATGAAVSTSIASLYPTVDGLFAIIAAAHARNAATLDVSYDGARGYPTSVAIDYVANAVDDEIGYRVSSFTPR